jgi:hypothetical protein
LNRHYFPHFALLRTSCYPFPLPAITNTFVKIFDSGGQNDWAFRIIKKLPFFYNADEKAIKVR